MRSLLHTVLSAVPPSSAQALPETPLTPEVPEQSNNPFDADDDGGGGGGGSNSN